MWWLWIVGCGTSAPSEPPAPVVEPPPPAPEPPPVDAPFHCFTWVHGPDTSKDCYRTLAACEQARTEMARGGPPCGPADEAYCTSTDPERCFGTMTQCEAYRAMLAGRDLEAGPCRPPPKPAFVVASELRVRAAPTTDSKVLGTLAINSPVTALGLEGDFAHIVAGSGTEGYVAAAFLRDTPLTLDEALTEARSTSELSWWQRAAAIDTSSREALEGLEAAYRAAGQVRRAEQVAEQLAWPHEVLIVARSRRIDTLGEPGVAVVQWRVNGDSHEGRVLSEAAWKARGIPETWTVLPDVGPPVEATVREVWAGNHNECSGTHVVEVVLDVPLPADRVPLAASRGAVPASWSVDVPVPALPRGDAEALVAKQAATLEKAEMRVLHGVSAVDGRWRGRILRGFGEPGDDWTVFEGWVDGDAFVADPVTGAGAVFDGYLELGRRDVDGDGVVERIFSDPCMSIAAPDGPVDPNDQVWEVLTDPWCCGC